MNSAQKNRKFISTNARCQIVASEAAQNPLTQDSEQLITSSMAQVIIDALRVIEINEQYGNRAQATILFGRQACILRKQLTMIEQTGELAMASTVFQLKRYLNL